MIRKVLVLGMLALLVSAAAATSAGATRQVGHADGRSCTRGKFVVVIDAVSETTITVHRLVTGDAKAASLVLRLNDQTVIRQKDQNVGRSSLTAPQYAIVDVRTCQGGGKPTETRLFSVTLLGQTLPPVTPGGGGDPPKPEPQPPAPAPAGCARGDFTAPLGAVGATSISFSSNGVEGPKTFSVSVNGETVITKGDATVGLGDLKPGDQVHVYVVRCEGNPPTLRATRVIDLGPATSTTA